MIHKSLILKIISQTITILSILVFATVFFPKAIGFVTALSLLWSLVIFIYLKPEINLSQNDLFFIIGLTAYPIAIFIATLISNGKWSGLSYPIYSILIIPIVLIFREFIARNTFIKFFPFAIAFSCIISFIYSYYETLILKIERSGLYLTNPIVFGQISGLNLLIILILIFYRSYKTMFAIPLLIIAIMPLYLSGSRGAWLGVLIVLIGLSFWYIKKSKKIGINYLLYVIYPSFLITLTTNERVSLALKEINMYYSGYKTTSIGLRLEMWKIAFNEFISHPIAGIGYGQFQHMLKNKVTNDFLFQEMKDFNHLHNQAIDTLLNFGLIGFSGLIVGTLSIILMFLNILHNAIDKKTQIFSLIGICSILASVIFSLTQPLFAHSISVLYFYMLLALCYCISSESEIRIQK